MTCNQTEERLEYDRQTFFDPRRRLPERRTEATLGAEEELWLADPETLKLADGAQNILASSEEGRFSGELIDCEIESNTGAHPETAGVVEDLASRRRELLDHAERLGRVLGASGTHPIGDWRAQRS